MGWRAATPEHSEGNQANVKGSDEEQEATRAALQALGYIDE